MCVWFCDVTVVCGSSVGGSVVCGSLVWLSGFVELSLVELSLSAVEIIRIFKSVFMVLVRVFARII